MTKGTYVNSIQLEFEHLEEDSLKIVDSSNLARHYANKILLEHYEPYAKEFHPYFISKKINLIQKKLFQCFLKRVVDLVGSLFGLVLLSPLLFIVGLLIKLDSKGPVFFKQRRVGLNGKEFEMWKFRTMKLGSEQLVNELHKLNETNVVMFKMKNDPRITKLGKMLRKYSIDELPQLINVLRGEMSLVGPRPPLLSEVIKYDYWHYVRFGAMPGITGLWQVSGRSDIKDFNKVVELDFKYILNWSILLDLILIMKTIPVVILAKGAS